MTRSLSMAAAAWLAWSAAALAQSDAEVAEIGQKFQENCLACHQPPDLQFTTDRAWLDQINRTT